MAALAGGGRDKEFEADLKPVPHSEKADGGSQVRGHVDIEVRRRKVEVEVEAWGLSPNLVHAQHIHGVGDNECPDRSARDDRVDDGLIDTVEGLPDYGPIVVSLTTKGDASPDSGLAVDRFPVADKKGKLDYERTFWIGKNFPRKVAKNLKDFHVVVHGIDVNHNEMYDFGAGVSSLDPALPLEATVPATCGLLDDHH
ncbi:MAG: hypothetical protein ABR529_12445 [Actinomycetota bacterium]